MDKIIKIDPLTGLEFVAKRENQVFASKKNRIKFHNLQAKKLREQLAFVEKPLRRNFQILNELLNGKHELEVHKEFLKGKGYNFEIASHIERLDKTLRVVVFNFILIHNGTEHIKIVKQ
ncbi:MAG: hypothetical protein ACO1O6_11040 [Bacteroidota bacterium]